MMPLAELRGCVAAVLGRRGRCRSRTVRRMACGISSTPLPSPVPPPDPPDPLDPPTWLHKRSNEGHDLTQLGKGDAIDVWEGACGTNGNVEGLVKRGWVPDVKNSVLGRNR
jgi:hypothetical protein